MRMLDLFSGIGGFSLAASWSGIETVAFCESDAYCKKVLAKHWPDVPIVDDIFKLRGDEFGPVDIVSGGFPCQPFSVAGKREGVGDDRFLWPQMLRVIKTARPTWVLGENVAGIINMALDDVLSDLEGIGYATQAIIVPACAVDAKHRRDRVWIIAHSKHNARRSKQLAKSRERKNQGPHQDSMPGGGCNHVANSEGERCGKTRGNCKRSKERTTCGCEVLANTNKGQFCGSQREICSGRNTVDYGGEDVSDSIGINDDRSGYGTSEICRERSTETELPGSKTVCHAMRQGLSDGNAGENRQGSHIESTGTDSGHERSEWPTFPGLGRVAHGLSSGLDGYWPDEPKDIQRTAKGIVNRTNRLKALGNAIVPQVAYKIFKSMVEANR